MRAHGWHRHGARRRRRQAAVAILQVDTDRRLGVIDKNIYGQFLEHINHSVEDGLFAEQIRGAGFEDPDFETSWTPFGPPEAVRVVDTQFERGTKVRVPPSPSNRAPLLVVDAQNARSEEVERPRKCPSCGNGWLRRETLHGIFDFQCRRCRLLTNVASDVRPGA